MMRLIRITVPFLAAMLTLTACLAQPHPKKNLFNLAAALNERPTVSLPARRTLLAGGAATAAGYDNRGLVYRLGPDRYDTDFYNEFLAPPARLLVDQATQYLAAHNRRVRVVKTPGLTLADYGLETYLESLYGDFTVDPPRAVINIRFTLNDLRGAANKVVWDKTYRREEPVAAKDAAGLVAAWNLALGDLMAELNRDIEQSVR